VEFLVVLVVLAAIVFVVTSPLRSGREAALEVAEAAERDELEAEREAKYREIRDAELDHRTGKLSDADWRALDRTLRGEAVEILRRIDALDAARGAPLP
jgi:flagellar biosynthesis/type III secretory pathway M-ring protein FliF/YscJ